ncbi:diguanylate cyclase (GGDEF)-like protein [Chitinivorax tropicus]|uniref:Diguanylate cyclase (GGDEF)-like protein n=1 Tax=Chitinivorax tropicus TaxID=714531 RepID=A0A840MPH0_9PROT|nr:EAL domain-containing protein [Chitinivorax tropicus]MBB5018989.1 diguanylate cyclase (GGDEF)-like protein [Chitinivorax tropicus]
MGYAHASTVVLNDAGKVISLGPSLSVYVDPANQLPFEAVRSLPPEVWQPVQDNTPNYGYSAKGYWFRTQLRLQPGLPRNWLIEVGYPVLDHVECWLIQQGRIVAHWHTGDDVPFSQRPVFHRNFLFPIELTPDSEYQLWLNVSSQGTVQLPITLQTPAQFIEVEQARLLPQAIYFGMLIVLLIYNAFIWIRIHERIYLYYITYVAAMLLGQMGIQGLGYQYLWSGNIWWQDKSMAVVTASFVTFVSLFTDEFLRLWLSKPWLSRFLRGQAGLAALIALGALWLPYAVMIRVVVMLALLATVVSLFSGLLSLKQGSLPARYFVAAWSLFLGGVLLYALQKYGLLPRNWMTEYGVQLGSVFEVVVVSIALADRINHERRKRYLAQKTALEEARHRAVAESRLLYQSLHDRLTGNPNRVLLEQASGAILDRATQSGQLAAFLLIKFAQFHEINNTLGHQAGDGLLKLVADRLDQAVGRLPGIEMLETGSNGALAHIEGVSFAALMVAASEADILLSAKELARAMRETVLYLDMAIDIPVMIGISLYPAHAKDFDSLLRCAEVAVEMVVHSEHDVVIYSDSGNRYSARRLSMMGELRQAMQSDGELTLFYQPKLDLHTRQVVGVEALLRWTHPVHGNVPPDQFVVMAEHTGLIKPLTQWVLQRALRQLQHWQSQGLALGMAVNISARNLREAQFCEQLLAQLHAVQISPDTLTLELTETAVMCDQEVALRVLRHIREAGVQIAMDDFGVGHSSLSYLSQLPICELKIDKSFIFALDRQPDDTAIVRTTINMAHDLGLRVVAEGIESEQVCERLQALGCDLGQGYHIARPMPAEQLVAWLRTVRTES